MRKQERINIELQKKDQRRICVCEITFLITHVPFCAIFSCFLCLLPPPSQVMCLLNGPIYDISMDGILCDDIMSQRSIM